MERAIEAIAECYLDENRGDPLISLLGQPAGQPRGVHTVAPLAVLQEARELFARLPVEYTLVQAAT